MADQVFPYHLAGFAVVALGTGYGISSLKQSLTQRVTSTEKGKADPNVPLLIHSRKRKRDPDITSLPPTKRRLANTVNTSLSADGSVTSDHLDAPPPIKSVEPTSDSEQGSVEGTDSDVASRPAHYLHTRSHYGAKISFRELKSHTGCGESYATVSYRSAKTGMDAVILTTKNKANGEDPYSDSAMIGDEFEHHNNRPNKSDDQNEERNRSKTREEDDDYSDDQIAENPDSEIHEEEDDDIADNDRNDHETLYHDDDDDDDDDDDFEDNEQEDSGAYEEMIQLELHRQNMVDVKISVSKGRSNNRWETRVQNRQKKIGAMRKRREREREL